MKTQRYLFALSILNLLLLAFRLLSRIGSAMASSRSDVLRVRALEITGPRSRSALQSRVVGSLW